MARIAIRSLAPELDASAQQIARELQLPLLDECRPEDYEILLEAGPAGLQIQPCGPGASGPVRVDFGSGAMRHRRRAGHVELLGRAAGAGKREGLQVVDATAGLGRDGFVLADSGCRVTMIEQSGLIHALLRDGLVRATSCEDPWLRDVSSRMTLVHADAREWLQQLCSPVDVIYLDPMFPLRSKSARVKKEMWLFQKLMEPHNAAVDLLPMALEKAVYRVVVKRPLKSEPLDGSKPGFSLKGKAVRFDVYSLRKL